MTDGYVLRGMVADEQVDFVALLAGLPADRWDTPSLCEKWSIHDLVIHIAIHAHTTARQRIAGLARARFSEERFHEPERARSKSELIEWLGSPARLGGPNDTTVQLSELVVHQQDARRPLGVARAIPGERLGVVLDYAVTRLGNVNVTPSRTRAKGLRLVATDVPWSWGLGPEVRGPGEALLMALNGRRAAIDDLEGDGLPVLAARLIG